MLRPELFNVDDKIDWHGRVWCSLRKCEHCGVTHNTQTKPRSGMRDGLMLLAEALFNSLWV